MRSSLSNVIKIIVLLISSSSTHFIMIDIVAFIEIALRQTRCCFFRIVEVGLHIQREQNDCASCGMVEIGQFRSKIVPSYVHECFFNSLVILVYLNIFRELITTTSTKSSEELFSSLVIEVVPKICRSSYCIIAVLISLSFKNKVIALDISKEINRVNSCQSLFGCGVADDLF